MAAVSSAPISIVRPASSGSSTRIQITQSNDGAVNPEPIKLEEEVELLDEFLSPRKLRALTGVEDLEEVTYLEMQVDTGGASMGNFGMHLPCLRQLKLSNSIIPSIRDLGTSLNSLEVLWMPQCCLECLDGLATMHSLTELYLAYNELQDVSACGMLEKLEILDLEGNLIDEVSHLAYLAICPVLSKLTLEGNPICKAPAPDSPPSDHYDYRSAVCQSIPQLQFLDDLVTTEADRVPEVRRATLQFDDHWAFINDVLVESGLLSEKDGGTRSPEGDSGLPSSVGRPSTQTSMSGDRPGSALRPSSAMKRLNSRGGSAHGVAVRPGTGQRLTSASGVRPRSGVSANGSQDGEALDDTDESILTAGVVVCGSISKALRHRRGESKGPATPSTPGSGSSRGGSAEKTRKIVDRGKPFNPNMVRPHTAASSSRRHLETGVDRSTDQIFQELSNWKSHYEKTRAEVAVERAPQILRITHDESFDVNVAEDDDDEDEDEEEVDSGAEEDLDLELVRAAAFRSSKMRFGVNSRPAIVASESGSSPPEAKVIVASKRFPSPPAVSPDDDSDTEGASAAAASVSRKPQPPEQPPPASSRGRLTSPARIIRTVSEDDRDTSSKSPAAAAAASPMMMDPDEFIRRRNAPESPQKAVARLPDPDELLAARANLPHRPATMAGAPSVGATAGAGARLRRVQLPTGGAALPSKPTLPSTQK